MDRALIFFKILLGHQNCDHALRNQRVSGDSSGFSQSKTEIPAPSSRLQVTAPGALGREAMKVTGFRVVQTVVYDYNASTGRWFCLLILVLILYLLFCLSCDVLWLYMMIYVYDVYCWIIRYWDGVVWWTQKMNMKCLCSAGLLMHLNHLPLEKQRYTTLPFKSMGWVRGRSNREDIDRACSLHAGCVSSGVLPTLWAHFQWWDGFWGANVSLCI